MLLESRLVRVQGSCPPSGPIAASGGHGGLIGYAVSNPDGDDGGPITDYDVIGRRSDRTGMFALMPPGYQLAVYSAAGARHDVGSVTLLVAGHFCRDVMRCSSSTRRELGLDAAALDALRHWPFRSENAVMYYPRVQAFDRLRGRFESLRSCGAAPE